ncbi:MFS transporter [Anatilimnocola floriformis]|uniref:MFS transporter n=1 Tax=Anatilimnocola floriformis TaxID=2948575 RepID=UPI0020C552AB|nr:MFS transporter [Anatilimnocola floriformis]
MPAEPALAANEEPIVAVIHSTAAQPLALAWQAHCNAFLWGLGNGLVSTTLASYLARQLGAAGLIFAIIFASQNIAGGLRLFTPWILQWSGSRKWFSIGTFVVSCLLLLILPEICEPGAKEQNAWKLWAFVGLWGGWHLAMFAGAIALWSWIGDLVPSRRRGKFIGVRQAWLMIGQILGLVAAGVFAYKYPEWNPQLSPAEVRWDALSWPALAGAIAMLLAVLPLLVMPDIPFRALKQNHARELLNAVVDRRFLPLLTFWCYAGLVNGVSQAVQGLYPLIVLKLPPSTTLAMVALMHLGQILISPLIGYFADRGYSRSIMIVSQIFVSVALFFFPLVLTNLAGKQFPLGMWLAYGFWIAYAGLNVCLPHLMLKLSPGENSPPYISLYFSLSGLAVALSSILCGLWFDSLAKDYALNLAGWSLDRFEIFFYAGGLLRLTSVVWLCLLPRGAGTSVKIGHVLTAPQLTTRS